MLYGGRHAQYHKLMFKLFQQLSEVAELIFFEDGPVVTEKYDTWILRHNNRFENSLRIIDKVYRGIPISKIVESANAGIIPSVITHLKIIKEAVNTYGKVIVTVTKECDAELARYASGHPAVIAVLADDTDFLVFPGKWRYWSLAQLNEQTLTTMEFSRTALRRFLNLNDKQLIVLSTIAGNDIVKYDSVRPCHQKHFGHNVAQKFPAIARLIKEEIDITNFNAMMFNLADFLFQDTSKQARSCIYDSFAQYNIVSHFDFPNWTANPNSLSFQKFNLVDDTEGSPLLNFCRINGFNSSYSILKRKPKNFTLDYWDLRRSDLPDIFETSKTFFQRQIGIILQHQRRPNEDIQYEIYAKRNLHEGYRKHFVSPVYPPLGTVVVPPLLNLLDRDQYPELDPVRYALLQWTISDNLMSLNLTAIPSDYFSNVLTLYQMVQERFIEIKEADMILLTVKQVLLNVVPQDLEYSPIVDERAFRISILFCKFNHFMGRTIKNIGLDHLNSLLNFDGVLFHKTYLSFKASGEEPASLLNDIKDYRIYATIK